MVLLCQTPNQNTAAAGINVSPNGVEFKGYQGYFATKDFIRPVDARLKTKREALEPLFTKQMFYGRDLLDIGANSGFFSMWALQNGATNAVAMEIDDEYLGLLKVAIENLNLTKLSPVKANFEDWDKPTDIILALAVVHWLYSCTATFGSLEDLVARFRKLTKYALIIEWVDPSDAAVQQFGHLRWNEQVHRGNYDVETFENALRKHFGKVRRVSKVNDTRIIYVAFVGAHEVDLSCPLPAAAQGTAISCRKLTELNASDCWSRVYDCGTTIVKQTSLDLAIREAELIRRLDGPNFPVVIDSKQFDQYSVLTLEKAKGTVLSQLAHTLKPEQWNQIVGNILEMMIKLQSCGIEHRNIAATNIIVDGTQTTLIDFGWSASADAPCVVPNGLPTPQDKQPCDIYSLGEMLLECLPAECHHLRMLAQFMVEEDPALRITDARVLLDLHRVHSESNSVDPLHNCVKALSERLYRQRALQMSHQQAMVQSKLELQNLGKEYRDFQYNSQLAHRELEERFEATNSTLVQVSNSRAWKIASILQRIRAKLR